MAVAIAQAEGWTALKNQLLTNCGALEKAWVEPAVCKAIEHGQDGVVLNFSVPTNLHKEEFQQRFGKKLEDYFRNSGQTFLGIKFDVEATAKALIQPALKSFMPATTPAISPAPYSPTVNRRTLKPLAEKFTFETFVVGGSNEVAHNAAFYCANAPGVNANPLFIHSPSGLGKTHLLFAFQNQCMKQPSGVKMLYTTGEQFLTDFVDHVSRSKMYEFRERYRFSADILLIDDIHTLGKGPAVQEELFNTLNHYFLERKQVIITCDQKPTELKNFTDRIRTRLGGGAVIEISWPDTQLRREFVGVLAEREGLRLADEVVSVFTQRNDFSLRELEGMLQSLKFHNLRGGGITLESLKPLLGEVKAQGTSLNDLQNLVCEQFNLAAKDLASRCRTKDLSRARQVYMFLARKCGYSLSEIGCSLGRDHTTVLSGLAKVKAEIEKDGGFQQKIVALVERVIVKEQQN